MAAEDWVMGLLVKELIVRQSAGASSGYLSRQSTDQFPRLSFGAVGQSAASGQWKINVTLPFMIAEGTNNGE